MTANIPLIDVAILASLIGSALTSMVDRRELRRWIAIVASGTTMVACMLAQAVLIRPNWFEGVRPFDWLTEISGQPVLVVDAVNAPMLSLVSLMFFVVVSTTMASKVERFPFGLNLFSAALMLVAMSAHHPWVLIVALIVQPIPVWWELRQRGHRGRVFGIHMMLFAATLVGGYVMVSMGAENSSQLAKIGVWLLAISVLIRNGCAPVHTWIADLFERATLGSALLFVAPMVGVYAAIKLLLPVADDSVLRTIALVSLFTAFYSAGMALVQQDTRRFLAYLFLSHASLVLVGLELGTTLGLTGSLCIWLSVGLALTGFGISVRAIEARTGRLNLKYYHGLYGAVPLLAVTFLLTGLAAVGFPGTFGFVGVELVVDGATTIYPAVGTLVVFAAALNGIAILRAFFHIFAGPPYTSTFDLRARWQEKLAVLAITVLLIGLGIAPQSTVESRSHAARQLMAARQGESAPEEHARHSDVHDNSRWGVELHTSDNASNQNMK